MRRREFITLFGSAVAATWPVAARGQQSAMPLIGYLSSRTAATDALVLPAFRQGLNSQGYFHGRNVTVEHRFADGQYNRLPELAADLARLQASVVVVVGEGLLGTRAVQAANTAIPIVFITGADPVDIGLVPNLNRPGGNITGVTSFQSPLAPKRLGLLHETLPRATTIAVLVNPTNVGDAAETPLVQEAARALRLQVQILHASTETELDAAFANLGEFRADALFVLTDPFFFSRAHQIVALAARHAIPTLYIRREFTAAGGLMSYGSSAEDSYRVLGTYAGRILKGEKPGDLPVQQPTKFELVINLKTAKALGLEIPPTVLALVDEVIE